MLRQQQFCWEVRGPYPSHERNLDLAKFGGHWESLRCSCLWWRLVQEPQQRLNRQRLLAWLSVSEPDLWEVSDLGNRGESGFLTFGALPAKLSFSRAAPHTTRICCETQPSAGVLTLSTREAVREGCIVYRCPQHWMLCLPHSTKSPMFQGELLEEVSYRTLSIQRQGWRDLSTGMCSCESLIAATLWRAISTSVMHNLAQDHNESTRIHQAGPLLSARMGV